MPEFVIASNRHASRVAAIIALPMCSYVLASRYYISAAFGEIILPSEYPFASFDKLTPALERPLHFSVFTSVLSGFFFLLATPWLARGRPSLTLLVPEAASLAPSKKSSYVRTAFIYGIVTFTWASWAMAALNHALVTTGTSCHVAWETAWFLHLSPYMMCVLDAAIIACTCRLYSRALDEGVDVSRYMGTLLLVVAGCVALLDFPSALEDNNLAWLFHLHWVDLRDIFLDSLIASTTLVSAVHLLPVLHPTTISTLVSSPTIFGILLPSLQSAHATNPATSFSIQLGSIIVTSGLLGQQFCFPLQPANSSHSPVTMLLHRWLVFAYAALFSLSVTLAVLVNQPSTNVSVHTAVAEIVTNARLRADRWASQAATSQSLDDAAREYQRRYGIPPPPNFDKWYQFAIEHGSFVIDDFTQIQEDLLPFWGLEPKAIRDTTQHLLEYPALGLGGLRIRQGKVEQSPQIPGTHRWMTDSIETMMKPFVQWLPDMDIAINLADECRVSVDFETKKGHIRAAEAARLRTQQASEHSNTWPESRWPRDFPQSRGDADSDIISRHFTSYMRRQIYYDFVAPSCPPSSVARNSRWWDWSTYCTQCVVPHSVMTREGPILADAAAERDLCHQPDVAYLDGFVNTPSMMIGTKKLVPIFSQGRVGGFSDILIPSPWNFERKSLYDDKMDPEWRDKQNSLFWRGSSSDGYAADGSWAGFLRTRLVSEAFQRKTSEKPHGSRPGTNISFTGDPEFKCHQADCAIKKEKFQLWSSAATSDGRPGEVRDGSLFPSVETPFDENWRFQHLVDVDGAGFSGRFLPFLRSRSLVYRAALYRTWYEERLQAWQHYVPVDLRLGSGFWAVLDLFGGVGRANDGQVMAEDIASQGREWANKALRKEDMQIYLFRLLLEWGRIVDDDREHLGYTQ
ncbi:hypothetical protein S7711_08390 [Stachybotrys chartarum IBT 7711]|uniref:Glycosyl transferase CAP10 domain-containing protein n=1 Tax=Stachybotrys chartarum (strain CBS 109288 / IBT 7711) TaxID=1280523 RepID=A0A084AVI9_STACB|nr:hypothetical protein S7711_08390 [Stachybotrys chartarum IBT 7711]